MQKSQIQFTITGKVQGVGYRSYILSKASKLGVAGEVWNDRSGSVSGVAVGETEIIRQFEALLREGPGSNVQVEIQPAYVSVPYVKFTIGRSR